MTIANYLIALSKDHKRLEAFRDNPEGVLKKVRSLTDAQKGVLLSGDALRIQHVIEFESGVDPQMIVCIVCKTPGQH